MAILFLLMAVTFGLIFFRKKWLAYSFFLITLIFCGAMFWHHITEILKIDL